MGLGNQLKPRERQGIIGAHKNGVPLKQIAVNIQRSYLTIKYTWQQRNERDLNQNDVSRSDRPQLVTDSESRALYKITRENPHATVRQTASIAAETEEIGRVIKRSTLKRRLAEFKGRYRKYKVKKSIQLLRSHTRKREIWALKEVESPQEKWDNAWFQDKCQVELGSEQVQDWV